MHLFEKCHVLRAAVSSELCAAALTQTECERENR